ncbi:other/FunK1 protein kinase [Coprinopsis cinerea okayama7|uniref:Other/FunK1 protein kinase n=1 Tax=Coprinopsis cinerea (strain Okayama-7 / 130 / ATCC MYA-4618 / FGSC 9003) TaxID=240176 RepID=A8NB64_COPC7|nr:other/FunK1 protein kinase [Coprinopsis cinerea okayama7\|eukprot:XP_001832065.2 other/FunK1 protein kinase [Coprinopsis cinerea okayama7\
MTVWYLSRSICIKSGSFNMMERPDILIKVLMSMLLSTRGQLGYDPLITLTADQSYVYELPPDGENRREALFCQTKELISEYHCLSNTGRSTRIWRVQQVSSPTDLTSIPGMEDRVLKHVSVDANKRNEGDVQESLFRDIEAFGRQPDWREDDILKEMPADDLEILEKALKGDNFKRLFCCIVVKYARGELELSPLPLPLSANEVASELEVSPKTRCFFVYEGVYMPLEDIPTLGEAMDIIRQSLRLMWCAGWVHRDVSIGNILASRPSTGTPWEVKLADLEHARKFPDPNILSDDCPIGTPHFMAVEVQKGCHFFPGIEERPKERKTWFPKRPVIQNYQHDLESIWWTILWLITARTRVPVSRVFADRYFRDRDSPAYQIFRSHFLSGDMPELAIGRGFPTSLPPKLYQDPSFLTNLDDLKTNLHAEYASRNRVGKQDDRRSYAWIVGKGASDFFRDIEGSREDWSDIELEVSRDSHPQGSQTVEESSSSSYGSSAAEATN